MYNCYNVKDVPIGTVVRVNYECKGEIFSEEAVLVDNYTVDQIISRIEVGCECGRECEDEIFVFETPKTKRFVLNKNEFNDYEKNIFKKYEGLNYFKLKVGKKVKIIENIYGAPYNSNVKFGTIGIISSIYQNNGDVKMASVLVKDKVSKKEIEIHVPLVNCIAIGK